MRNRGIEIFLLPPHELEVSAAAVGSAAFGGDVQEGQQVLALAGVPGTALPAAMAEAHAAVVALALRRHRYAWRHTTWHGFALQFVAAIMNSCTHSACALWYLLQAASWPARTSALGRPCCLPGEQGVVVPRCTAHLLAPAVRACRGGGGWR